MYLLLSMWDYGRSRRQHQRAWLCGDADDRLASGSLCIPGDLGLYGISVGQDAAYTLCILSGVMGIDSVCSFYMFFGSEKKNQTALRGAA